MQDPNEDTEWNDALRARGIIGPKPKEKEFTEDDIVSMVENVVKLKTNDGENEKKLSELDLDELDELEDSEDEAVLLEYRKKRMAELKLLAQKSSFGNVLEISAQDYVNEVNKAGKNVWVVLHLYKPGIPLCALLNQHLYGLANKFPTVKFVKSISTTCIPNYPDRNLPTIFVYFEGDLKAKFIGSAELRGPSLTLEELEFILGRTNAIDTPIKEDPRRKVRDKMFSDLSESNDW